MNRENRKDKEMKALSAFLFSALAALLLPANAEARPEAESGPWGPFWVFSPDWTCPEEQEHKNADFFRAVAYDLRDRVQVLLDCGADINVRNSFRQVALHWAMYLDDPWMADFLISRGADQSARDGIGLTPAKSAELRDIRRSRRKAAQLCAEGEEVNPFNESECRLAFSCPAGQTEVAENTCECPAEAPHYVNGKCLDKPYCPSSGSSFRINECSECPAGKRRFKAYSYGDSFKCAIPKECQEPEYALSESNFCEPTNVCPGPEVGEPRHTQCQVDVALRTLDGSKCPEGAENEACRVKVALWALDGSKCPEGAENEACRAAVWEAQLANEIEYSPAWDIKGIARAISLGLSGDGVTVGVAENVSTPYWKDDCSTGHGLAFHNTVRGGRDANRFRAWGILPKPNEDVPARYINYEQGDCDRGLVRTHSDLPSIRVDTLRKVNRKVNPASGSSVLHNPHYRHVIAVFGVMAAQRDGYGLVGVAPDADYVYASFSHDWDDSPDVEIVNYSVGDGEPVPITVHVAVDENGATLTAATRENLLNRSNAWALTHVDRMRLAHVTTHLPADRRINVIAAGNESFGELSTFSGLPLYFPELRGNNLAVVAAAPDTESLIGERILPYSNRCGLAGASFCIAAPISRWLGVWGLYPDVSYESHVRLSGTSFAAPMVAGALALIKEYFNRMGGIGNDELVRRLLATADKSERYADESIYGAGLLDLENALTPQGELRLFSGQSVSDSESHLLSQSGLRTGPAFGDSIDKALEDSEIAAFDKLNAPFPVVAAGLVQSERENGSLRDALLALQFGRSSPPKAQWDFANGFGWWSLRGGNSAGQPEIESIFGADDVYANPYSALAGDGMSGGLEWDSFRMEMFGESPGQDSRPRGAVGSFSFAPFSEARENGGWIFHFGGVEEPHGFLSSSGSGAFADLRARTAFVGADYVGAKMNGWRLHLGGFAGDTSAEDGGWFAGTESLRSDSFHLGVERENIFHSGDGLGFRLHQPLRASGSLKIRIPTGRTRYGDLTWREVSGKTSGRELSLEGLYRRSFEGGSWRISAGAVSEPGHRAEAKTIGRLLFAFDREF